MIREDLASFDIRASGLHTFQSSINDKYLDAIDSHLKRFPAGCCAKRGYVPHIDRATPRKFCKGGVKPGSQYVAQQCGAARCGVTQAPCRAFNCTSVFTILIKSARPHPLYPRVRIDFIGLAASAARIELGSILAARRDSWALECSKIVASDTPRSCATYCQPAKNEVKVGAGPAVRMLITQFYTC